MDAVQEAEQRQGNDGLDEAKLRLPATGQGKRQPQAEKRQTVEEEDYDDVADEKAEIGFILSAIVSLTGLAKI